MTIILLTGDDLAQRVKVLNKAMELKMVADGDFQVAVYHQEGSETKTGTKILQTVGGTTDVIRVSCMKGDYHSCFSKGDGNEHDVIVRTDQQPFHYVQQQIRRVDWALLLYHEYGHARQYLLKPEWYNKMINVGYLPIEMDNLREHEWPLADELKIPRRHDYAEFAESEERAIKLAAASRIRRAWRKYTVRALGGGSSHFDPTKLLRFAKNNDDKIVALYNIINWFKNACNDKALSEFLPWRAERIDQSAFLTTWQGLPKFQKNHFVDTCRKDPGTIQALEKLAQFAPNCQLIVEALTPLQP